MQLGEFLTLGDPSSLQAAGVAVGLAVASIIVARRIVLGPPRLQRTVNEGDSSDPPRFGPPRREAHSRQVIWSITVTTDHEVPDCKVYLVYAHRDLPTCWLAGAGVESRPALDSATLLPLQTATVAIAIRSDMPGLQLPRRPAILCGRRFHGEIRAGREPDTALRAGLHPIALKLVAPTGTWTSSLYWLTVPEDDRDNDEFVLWRRAPR